jgi:predicted transcriptional regulator
MSEESQPQRLLPVHFTAFDLEHKLKPMALVACPRHPGDARPLAFCGKCGHCRHVAVVSAQEVTLACDVSDLDASSQLDERCGPRWVHELTRVPKIWCAFDTPLAALMPELSREECELVPVLDREGSLLGVVIPAVLHAAAALLGETFDGSVTDLMSATPRSIRFDASQTDAIRMFGSDPARFLAVIQARNKFLGILAREDLEMRPG